LKKEEETQKASKIKTKEGAKEAAMKVQDPKAPNPSAPAKAPEQDLMQKEAKVAPAVKDDMKASF
jgi:hypothetical protein